MSKVREKAGRAQVSVLGFHAEAGDIPIDHNFEYFRKSMLTNDGCNLAVHEWPRIFLPRRPCRSNVATVPLSHHFGLQSLIRCGNGIPNVKSTSKNDLKFVAITIASDKSSIPIKGTATIRN
jgi:hypothetical protein